MAKQVCLVLIVVAVVVGLVCVRNSHEAHYAREARLAGMTAFERGDHVMAYELLGTYLTQVDDDVTAIQACADARMQVPVEESRHVAETLGLFRESLRLLDSGDVDDETERQVEYALRRLIELYGITGRRYEQIKVASRLLLSRPDDVDALSARAVALYLDRDFDGAIRDAERLTELEPETLRWRQLQLEVLRHRGASSRAMLALCQRWIEDDPDDVRCRLLRCGVLVTAGRVPEARTEVQTAARLGVDRLEDLQTLLATLDRLGMPEAAPRVLAETRKRFSEAAWVRLATAQRHWQAGRTDLARAEIEAAMELDVVPDPDLLELATLLAASAEQTESARDLLAELRERFTPERDVAGLAWVAALEARLDLGVRPWPEIVHTIQHAVLLQSNDPVLHLIQGEAYLEVGEIASALAAFEHAYRLDPSWAAAGVSYADALLRTGRPDEALKISERVLRRADRTMLAPYVVYARAFLDGGDDGQQGQDVTVVFEQIFAMFPNEPDLAALLAEMYVRAGRNKAARNLMRRVAARTSPDPAVLLALAGVAERHEMEDARTLVERARDTSGLTIPVAFALARHDVAAGRVGRAELLVEEALAAAEPAEVVSRGVQQQRVAFLLAIDHDEAVPALRSFQVACGSDPAASMFVLGTKAAWTDESIVMRAVDDLRGQLGPTSHNVRLAEARARLRFQITADLHDEVRTSMTQVLERAPDSLAALTLMAEATQEIEHLERAVNLYPFVLELYPTLVAWRQVRGDFDGARDLLQQLAAIEHRERASNFETAMLRASRVFVRPDADIGRLTQAIRHHRAGRPRHAEAMFEVLLARRETSVVAAAQAADFFAATGRFEQGRDVLLGLDDRRLNRALLIGVYHRRHGQPEEAVRWLTTATSAATHADQARRELAALLVERGDRSAAITLLRESGSGSDELLALLLLLEKVPADATPIHPTVLAEARDLLDRHGSLPATWNLAIRLHVRAGRTDEALKIARRAGLRFPGHDEPARWEAQLVARRTADGGGE